MSNVLDYDKTIIKTLHHIEDILVKFALQNYASAGAVFLAHFGAKLPLKVAAPVVVVLGVAFLAAIGANVARYRVLWKMHRVARDEWLKEQSGLRDALRQDADCEAYLATRAIPRFALVHLYLINSLPALAAVALVVLRLGRVL